MSFAISTDQASSAIAIASPNSCTVAVGVVALKIEDDAPDGWG